MGGGVNSIFEVGCGSGANLFYYGCKGISVGGIDYSSKLVEVASKVLTSDEIICDEAINLPTKKKYDAVFSNSVFSYFENEAYAKEVLDKMNDKALYSLGLIDIHDINKKEDFEFYRKQTVENYEEKYKNLPKLFYSKDFFVNFAKEKNMEIIFTKSEVEGYWNNDFVFSCYMYKN